MIFPSPAANPWAKQEKSLPWGQITFSTYAKIRTTICREWL
jgi:hypothetical protein